MRGLLPSILLGASLVYGLSLPILGGFSYQINGSIIAKYPSGGDTLCYFQIGACESQSLSMYASNFTADLSISGPQNLPCTEPLPNWNLDVQNFGGVLRRLISTAPYTPPADGIHESGIWIISPTMQITAAWTNTDGSNVNLGFAWDGVYVYATPNATGFAAEQNIEDGGDCLSVVELFFVPDCTGILIDIPGLLDWCIELPLHL
ncbi:hypothetical protein DACRYDRAFT_108062 [Dacryopinax primogenitus]|uniref:Uncharacterized protein n=1 Tax=Dacryopinax primogenitus (strain DJM 731) TaxID=1858805 RepID=M5GBW2_DACPD|nr:uncharacterized protein DACRYDRAFT_108062 [Dacryopinax primogenitus]EJU01513.1 hypothetical protein DACRYDRAFT_108062 [Dacryopinax primogenitus]